MNKKFKLVLWTIMGMLLVSACGTQPKDTTNQKGGNSTSSQDALSTPSPKIVPTVDPELLIEIETIAQKCVRTQPGQVCFGRGPIEAQVQPDRLLFKFSEQGDITNLADLQSLKVGTAGSPAGLALLRIQTEHLDEAFTVVAFGDVELINEVPYGVQEFNGMQSMQLTTGPNKEGEIPDSGLLVQAPKDGKGSTLVINGVEMIFGSTAILTSAEGSLKVQTLAGTVMVNTPDQVTEVVQGTEDEILLTPLTPEEGEDLLTPLTPAEGEDLLEPLTPVEGEELLEPLTPPAIEGEDLLTPLTDLLPQEPDPYAESLLEEVHEMIKKLLAEREKQKNWKGGWWKETYGPKTVSGGCYVESEAVGDGAGGGGPVEPFSREVPICRGNNGNTILMYDSGQSYNRIGPNIFANTYSSEWEEYEPGVFITNGDLQTLRIVSPTRMVFTFTSSTSDGCTTTQVIYYDFVRDDPNVRCGKIIDLYPIPPNITPEPTPMVPTPAPFEDPPRVGQYSVRAGIPLEGCDAPAKAFAPDFQTANLTFTQAKDLILESPSALYELKLTDQLINYYSDRTKDDVDKYGVFMLEQPLNDEFQLMMDLIAVPGHGFTGDWLVTNPDGSQMCGGSIDLLPQP